MRDRAKYIGQKIIQESFPNLLNIKIHFIVIRFRFYALSLWIPPFLRLIVISTHTRDFSDEVLTGIIAHELCHQERYHLMGLRGYMRFVGRYIFSKKAQTDEERATDTLTIEKGYGRQLYELTLISRKDKNHKSILENYLSPQEIESYARKIGKW
jgi:hypothetical protein